MKKIIWSVDAFQTETALKSLTEKLLRKLTTQTGASVEPVYVLSPTQINLAVEFSEPSLEKYKQAAQKAVEHSSAKLKIPGLLKPKMLIQNAPSISKAVASLNAHAAASGADLIVVGTHAKKGLERAFLGSFAESLLLSTKVPVLTVNPHSKIPAGKDHIVFATDLSEESNSAFKEVLDLALALSAKLTIYHHVPNPVEPVFQSGVYLLGGGWVPISSYIHEESAKQKEVAQELLERAQGAGLKAEVVIATGKKGITPDLLNLVEKKKISLIAMTGKSGPVAATLIGSVVRQVVRAARCPVWVIRTKPAPVMGTDHNSVTLV